MNTPTHPELSIVLPCRNEREGISVCLQEIVKTANQHSLTYEIIVSDSSTDGSHVRAQTFPQTHVVKHDQEGYGRAIQEGVRASQGLYILIADADGSYDLSALPQFVNRLRAGADCVIGNRFAGERFDCDAMPWHHRYIGNPLLSWFLRLCTGSRVRDAHCGIRAISRTAYDQLRLHTEGMEFASEFVLEAHRKKLRIEELPVNYRTRLGTSKLRSFRDGWKHLRFILLYSPFWLFVVPGLVLCAAGGALFLLLGFGPLTLWGITFSIHPLFFAATSVIVGFQLLLFGVFARTYAAIHLNHYNRNFMKLYKHFTIERAGIVGLLLTAGGALLFGGMVYQWVSTGFGELREIYKGVLALTLIILGVQTLFSSFIISLLGIKKKHSG